MCVSVCVCVVLGRMCVVLQMLSRSVVLQAWGVCVWLLQVLGQVLGLVLQVLGRERGRGLLRSLLFTHPHNFIFANPGQPRSLKMNIY